MTGELIWAFDAPKTVGSIHRANHETAERWGDGVVIDPTVPMYTIREATREEWEASGGATYYGGPIFCYAVSVD